MNLHNKKDKRIRYKALYYNNVSLYVFLIVKDSLQNLAIPILKKIKLIVKLI